MNRAADTAEIVGRPTTHGTIALCNLDAQIEALQEAARFGRGTVGGRAGLAELLTLRGVIVGRIADYKRAGEITDRLVDDAPSDPAAVVAQARSRATFHRFAQALDDLDRAERLSLDRETANGERAAIS